MAVPQPTSEGELIVHRILLIEDNAGDVFLVRRAMEQRKLPHSLSILRNGEEALRFIEQHENGSSDPLPDVILLDLNLPRVDGAQVLSRIRATPGYADIPVILLTSSNSSRDRDTVMSLGATTYFPKPVDLQTFMELGRVVEETLKG